MIIEHITSFVENRIKKWHPIVDFWIEPCEAPLSVYVRTVGVPAVKAILHLLSFGLDDVARGALRPRDVYPRAHFRGKGGRRRNRGIPELGEEIGKRVFAIEAQKMRATGAGERMLWLADGIEQRAMFWVMVGSIAENFASEWTRSIVKSGYCSQPGPGKFLARRDPNIATWWNDKDIPFQTAAPILYSNGYFNWGWPDFTVNEIGTYRFQCVYKIIGPTNNNQPFEMKWNTAYPVKERSRFVVTTDDTSIENPVIVSFEGNERLRRGPQGQLPTLSLGIHVPQGLDTWWIQVAWCQLTKRPATI